MSTLRISNRIRVDGIYYTLISTQLRVLPAYVTLLDLPFWKHLYTLYLSIVNTNNQNKTLYECEKCIVNILMKWNRKVVSLLEIKRAGVLI